MGEFDRIIEFAIRTDVELYTAMPSGWRKITGSMTAPRGSTWMPQERPFPMNTTAWEES